MGETSDGESSDGTINKNKTKINFDNLSNTNSIIESILKSDEMKKFATKVVQNKYIATTQINEELNADLNAANFKQLLKIPSRSEISANIIDKNLTFNFLYVKNSKQKSYSFGIPLSKNRFDECVSPTNTNKTSVIESTPTGNTSNDHVAATGNVNNTNNEPHGTNGATQSASSQNSKNSSGMVDDTVNATDDNELSNFTQLEYNETNFELIKNKLETTTNENAELKRMYAEMSNKVSVLEAKMNEICTSPQRKIRKRNYNNENDDEMELDADEIASQQHIFIKPNAIDIRAKKNNNNNNKAQSTGPATTNESNNASTNNVGEHNFNETTKNNNIKRTKTVPPIVVYDQNQKRMAERIENLLNCGKKEYYFVRVNKNKYRIILGNLVHFDKVVAHLREIGIRFHTYTPIERKPIYVILKYVPNCYDEAEIRESLMREYKLTPAKLTPFVTGYMREQQIDSSMWRAQFNPGTDKKKILEIDTIGNQKGIVVEEMKHNTVTQCRNCWRFEHSFSNCSYVKRCYQCDKIHEEGECALDADPALLPWCVNCRSNNHNAQSKDCEVYQRILERKKVKKPARNDTITTKIAPRVNVMSSPSSYAGQLKTNRRRNPTQALNNDNIVAPLMQFMQQQQEMFNNFFKQLAPLIGNGNTNGKH